MNQPSPAHSQEISHYRVEGVFGDHEVSEMVAKHQFELRNTGLLQLYSVAMLRRADPTVAADHYVHAELATKIGTIDRNQTYGEVVYLDRLAESARRARAMAPIARMATLSIAPILVERTQYTSMNSGADDDIWEQYSLLKVEPASSNVVAGSRQDVMVSNALNDSYVWILRNPDRQTARKMIKTVLKQFDEQVELGLVLDRECIITNE